MTDARQVVLTRTRLSRPPAVPELVLHLADDMDAAWASLQAELDDGELPPPFWAFAWLGGQAVARHVLDHPEVVAGRTVLDLATGSGICALAAARAGAASVRAVDVDRIAVVAVGLNAAANDLTVAAECVDVLQSAPPHVDVVLAGDVFYDAEMSALVRPWLRAAAAQGSDVLVGDPGRHYLPQTGTTALAAYDVPTTRDLEGVESKRVRVFRFGAEDGAPAVGR